MTRRGGRRGSGGNAPQVQIINNQPSEAAASLSVCKYFLSGHCKYGNACRFQHIGNPQMTAPAQSQPKQQHHQQHTSKTTLPGQVSMEDVVLFDLSINIPWPFSCYGIVENWELGGNMIVGDYSQEELRMEAYAQQRSLGNIHSYQQQVALLKAAVDARRAAICSNPKFAIEEACSRKPVFHQVQPQIQPQIQPQMQPLVQQQIQQQQMPIPQARQLQSKIVPTPLPPTAQPPLVIPQPPIQIIPQQNPHALQPQQHSQPVSFEFGKIPEVLPTKKA